MQINTIFEKDSQGSFTPLVIGINPTIDPTSSPVLRCYAIGAVDEAFTYDPVGNRLTASGTPGNWEYNNNNELETHGDTSYIYDANGNMTQKTVSGVVTRFFSVLLQYRRQAGQSGRRFCHCHC